MESIIMALIMGGLGGPAIATAVQSEKMRTAHEERKARFAAGKGKDPDKGAIGPHKPFTQNALVFGSIFATIGFFIGTLA